MALNSFTESIKDCQPDFVAGHSLGEFSALVANGVIDFEDAMYLVHKRGEFMIKANDGTPFAMSAVMGLDSATVKAICEEVSVENIVVAANYNTQNQTVISGSFQGVEKAGNIAKERNAKRVMPLVVGGAFHSPLVKNASIWLAEEMKNIKFNDTSIPVICNVNATPETSAQKIMNNLKEQVTASVLWVDSIKYLASQGVNIFIEFGPKKVLSGMITTIIDGAVCFNIDKITDIDVAIQKLGEI
jgi:[acyl-carrier-protein] S-malonyltransferase